MQPATGILVEQFLALYCHDPSYLYLNGVIGYSTQTDIQGTVREICRFSSPFIQKCLFDALTSIKSFIDDMETRRAQGQAAAYAQSLGLNSVPLAMVVPVVPVLLNSTEQIYREWNSSEVFISLRNYDKLKGKHGKCEYRKVCGGCRARVFEAAEDYLAEEPLCLYKLKPIP